MAKKLIEAAVAAALGLALVPVMTDYQQDALSADNITSTQSSAVTLVLIVFIFGLVYAAYRQMVQQ